MARITLYGFMTYDKTLFDDIVVPEACDKEALINTIVMNSGDLFPYYQHPDYLKRNINNWFRTMSPQFERMFKALSEEYSPIENYDRYENTTDTRQTQTDTDTTQTHSADSTSTDSGSGSNESWDDNSTTGTDSKEDKTSAYNSNTYQNNNLSTGSNSTTVNGHNKATTSNSANSTNSISGADITDGKVVTSDSFTHTGRLHGNIGVTTAMAMINEELALRKYDIYMEIARMFEKRFIVQVY